MTMQTENTAADTTTDTAQTAGTDTNTDAAQASATSTEATSTDTSTTAANEEGKEGKQQEAGEHTDTGERDDQGRFKSKVQKRIDELTHARHTAEREAARWRSIAEGKDAAPAPKINDFATDEEYDAAVRKHEIREAAREISADNAHQAAAQYQQDAARAVDQTYDQRIEAAKTRLPDFVQVVTAANVQISDDMAAALKESEYGPDLVYQLAKNPEEAQRLASLSTRQLDREIGRMEAAIAAKGVSAPTAPAARTTKAPAPAGVGMAAGSAPANTDPAKMTMAEYEVWRAANGSKYVR